MPTLKTARNTKHREKFNGQIPWTRYQFFLRACWISAYQCKLITNIKVLQQALRDSIDDEDLSSTKQLGILLQVMMPIKQGTIL